MMVRLPGSGSPVLLARKSGWYKAYLQVVGPAQIRLSGNRFTLLLSSGGLDQGLTVASSDGLVALDWQGELWAISDTPDATVQVEVLG